MAFDLKKPEDVKEYLKNLHTEYKFGCYSEKKPEVCHLLGDFVESIKKDFNLAARIYKKNCDEYDYGRSCTKFGDFAIIGKGCDKNVTLAWEYMRKGCELNDENGCVHGGIFGASYRQGMPKSDAKLIPKPMQIGESDAKPTSDHSVNNDGQNANVTDKIDYNNNANERRKTRTDETEQQIIARMKIGMTMLEKACDTWKSDKACFYLSGIHLAGIEGLVEKNLKEAYKASLKSCELGNPYACANVSRMHKLGDGVQKNPDLAETFMKRAEELMKETNSSQSIKFQQGT